ncbi:MAG: TetR/AcrR family transcriptional regulator, partial [Chloroflexota bacterium]
YKRVTIDDIASHADVGKGTVYLHWPTREALFHAVVGRELAQAMDEVAAAVRVDSRASLLHALMRTYFFALMRRPLLRALLAADPEVLGKLARADGALRARLRASFDDYVRLLAQHGLVRTDIAAEELSYAVHATTRGFFQAETAVCDEPCLSLERKASLLATTVQRAFEIDAAASPEAIQAAASRVADIFAGIAGHFRAQVRQAYE